MAAEHRGTREQVPLQDPAREYRELREGLDAAVLRVAASGRYVLGPELEAFEAEFAERVGARHAVGVGSGTDALILALEALGIGAGDEVVTSPFTFFATAEAILRVGAEPVFADIRPDTFDLDPEAAAAAITPRTVALLPVHLYGQMARMEAFRELADRRGLALLEDAAQAVGAERHLPDGRTARAGPAGDAGCFSFYPTK
ncbi:MAG TPA: aminotransferase class I/II-fold pyridoxal phosphate-dependent enzyme, partial [Gemmatimonadota bacterium]|nr:aminotransferase class I/II-fold pyridoxal phosphate-dependent enzyme [Gemmatimonadota bacterium]